MYNDVIGQMGSVLANDRASISGRVLPKTKK